MPPSAAPAWWCLTAVGWGHVDRWCLTLTPDGQANAFSKKLENHQTMIALHYRHYDFGAAS